MFHIHMNVDLLEPLTIVLQLYTNTITATNQYLK